MSNQIQIDSATLTRRRFLQIAGATAGAAALPIKTFAADTSSKPAQAFRFAHLADIHVKPELRADEGFRACLKAVHELKPRPDFILTGGDMINDALPGDPVQARMLFNLFNSICADSDIPFRHCIGNHEVFGWSIKDKNANIDPTLYGKKMAQQYLNLPETTYSFDHKGWHFSILDDVLPSKTLAYEGGLTEEQMHWLNNDLTIAKAQPKIICAHIPIASAAAFYRVNTGADNDGQICMIARMVCRNAGPILELLNQHAVDLVLFGHLHLNEKIQYQKTTHIGEGAVCGRWWKGPYKGSSEGFGVIDVRPDGTFEHHYHTYGWKAATNK